MTTVLWITKLSIKTLDEISVDIELCRASELKYIEMAGNIHAMLDKFFMESKLSCYAERVDFCLGAQRNQNGQIVAIKAESIMADIVGRIADSLWDRDDLSRFLFNQVSIPRVKNYLERCIEEEIRKNVYLAAYLFWLRNQNEAHMKRNILMIPVNPWGKEIKSYMRELGLEVRLFEDRSDSFLARFKPIIKSLVYGSGYIIKNILVNRNTLGVISKKVKPCEKNQYKISVPYQRSVNPEERNDLFWYKNSGLAPETIIITLESLSKPFDKPELELLHSQGFSGIVRSDKNADLTGTLPMWKNTKRLIIMEIRRIWFTMKTVLFARRNWESFWQWSRLVELMRNVNQLQAYYESEDIRVDIGLDSQKTSAIRAIAMDNIGGVRVGPQWSSVELLSSFLSKNDNIYFCWGKSEEQFFSKARSCIDTLIISGYIYDRYFEYIRPQAKKLREQLTASGAQFIITLLDNRVDNVHTTVKDMEYFYQLLLNEFLNDQTFGLIIKSKDSGVFKKLKNIKPMINDARKTGRCLVLEENSEVRRNLWGINNMFTFLPAMASDLTVNFSISTSGTESALAGARAIYYDHMKQPDHLYYMNGSKNRLVFDDLKELIVAIQRYRAGELPDLGDHSPILDEIDPFRDGKAGERIGIYIKWFMDKLNAGCDRNEAIDWSNAQYAAKWGSDKIISLN